MSGDVLDALNYMTRTRMIRIITHDDQRFNRAKEVPSEVDDRPKQGFLTDLTRVWACGHDNGTCVIQADTVVCWCGVAAVTYSEYKKLKDLT